MAPRTIRNVKITLNTLARDAVAAEYVRATFCVFPSQFLPKIHDKNPAWREGAVFAKAEVIEILSSDTVPLDRRMFCAIEFMTGLRFGEVAGRRWREYDTSTPVLGKLAVPTQYMDELTKTQVSKPVPVHSELARMLEHWRREGFPFYFGRAPKPDDLIVPSRLGKVRSVRHMHRKLQEDLARLGLRGRRQHDTRRTFITLALSDGARKDVLRALTHPSPKSAFDAYPSFPWEITCEAVAQLKIELPSFKPPDDADGEPDDEHDDHDDAASVEGNLAKVIPFPSRRR